MKRNSTIAACVVTIGFSISIYAAESLTGLTGKSIETQQDIYIHGMGEIMASTQMRHSKLWFAGKSENWNLARYELDEIKEGFDDAVKFHPVFKRDAPIAGILGKFTAQPLDELEKAVEAKDSLKFRKSFDNLTRACNGCHQATGQEFIVIKRPGILPFSNQEFSVTAK